MALEDEGAGSDDIHADPGNDAGTNADDNGAPAGDKPGSGRDADQTGDHAVHGADNGGLLEEDDVHACPREQGHGSADVSVEDSGAGIRGSRVRITAIEAVPADPEDASSNHHERDIVGGEILSVFLEARPDPVGANKGGRAGGQVDNITTGIVENAQFCGPATAPDAVGAGAVGKDQPEWHEYHPGREIHAREIGTGDQGEGDRCKDELEVDHRRLWKVLAHVGGRKRRLDQLVAHADDGIWYTREGKHVFTECDFIAHKNPDDECHRKGVEDLANQLVVLWVLLCEKQRYHHHAVDDPSPMHQSSIENTETRYTLQGDKRSSSELPCVVTSVQPSWGRIC